MRLRNPKAWRTIDARGADVTLFNCPSAVPLAAQRLDISPREFRLLRRESAVPGGCGGLPMGVILIFAGSQVIYRMSRDLRNLDFDLEWSLFNISGLALVVAGFLCFRLRGSSDPGRFARAMLARFRCPRCVYHLDMCMPDPSDGVTVCPECGAAWRLRSIPLPAPPRGSNHAQ